MKKAGKYTARLTANPFLYYENEVYQELEEYVVTSELFNHFQTFYDSSVRSIDGETDEMGQYVGDNTDLMLNMQTVTEDLGIHSKGRA